MTMFWIIAALLTSAALLFVLPPLLQRVGEMAPRARDLANATLYREEIVELERERDAAMISAADFTEARREIEHRVLEDVSVEGPVARAAPAERSRWRAAATVGLFIPIFALGGYSTLGNPEAFRTPTASRHDPHAIGPQQIGAMAARLAERLERAPGDAEGWAMLARSLNTLGRHEEAARAYARLAGLLPANADVLAEQADALAMARGRKLDGEPFEIVKRALGIDPNHVKSLALAGSAEFERGNFSAAASHWERALASLSPESPFARSLRSSLEQARASTAARGRSAAR